MDILATLNNNIKVNIEMQLEEIKNMLAENLDIELISKITETFISLGKFAV